MVTALVRTVILYAVLIIGLRLTGKRQIGQLEPIELVLTMLISDLAAVPMQDFGIPLVNGLIPIAALLAMSTMLSCLNLKSVRFRALVCGEPAIVIREGQLCQDVMRRNRLTPDEVMEELRSQGVGDLKAVKYAVLETTGHLSVLPYTHEQGVTPKQLGLAVEDDVFLPVVIINDGRVMTKALARLGKDDAWLRQQLAAQGLNRTEDVFLLTVGQDGTVTVVAKEGAA